VNTINIEEKRIQSYLNNMKNKEPIGKKDCKNKKNIKNVIYATNKYREFHMQDINALNNVAHI